MKLFVIALFAGSALTGCTTVKAPTETFNALTKSEREADSNETKAALADDFRRAMAQCTSQMQSLRDSFTGSGKTQITIATVGIIAGSVVVPTLAAKAAISKSALAGWGGVSGAANAAQYTLQQNGTSGSEIGAVYESVRADIEKYSSEYINAKTNSLRAVAINQLSVSCAFPRLPTVTAPAKP